MLRHLIYFLVRCYGIKTIFLSDATALKLLRSHTVDATGVKESVYTYKFFFFYKVYISGGTAVFEGSII